MINGENTQKKTNEKQLMNHADGLWEWWDAACPCTVKWRTISRGLLTVRLENLSDTIFETAVFEIQEWKWSGKTIRALYRCPFSPGMCLLTFTDHEYVDNTAFDQVKWSLDVWGDNEGYLSASPEPGSLDKEKKHQWYFNWTELSWYLWSLNPWCVSQK